MPGGLHEIVKVCDKTGGTGVIRSLASHILVKIKTFKVSGIIYGVILKLLEIVEISLTEVKVT